MARLAALCDAVREPIEDNMPIALESFSYPWLRMTCSGSSMPWRARSGPSRR